MIRFRGSELSVGQAIAGAVSGLAVVYFVFWACAPTTYVDPGGPVAPGQFTVGGAVSATSIPGGKIDSAGPVEPAFDSQLWMRRQWDWASFGAGAFAGQTGLFGGGMMGRLSLLKDEEVELSIEGQLGWLWGAVALPMSVRVAEGLWLFTSPSIGNRIVTVQLPAGISIDLDDDLFLTIAGGIESEPDTNNIDNLRFNDLKSLRVAVGLQYRFNP